MKKNKMKKRNTHKNKMNKAVTLTLTGIMAASNLQVTTIQANDDQRVSYETDVKTVDGSVITPEKGYTFLSPVNAENAIEQTGNVVTISYQNGEKTRLTFLETNLFRLDMEPDGESFKDYATPNNAAHTGRIQQQVDSSDEYSKPTPTVIDSGDLIVISTQDVRLEITRSNAMMRLIDTTGETERVVWEEKAPLQFKENSTIQTLVENEEDKFYGGGTQNGRFAHKGKSINIVNENGWVDGEVSSPNPFYWSTSGYGIIRNTFKPGVYDFGETNQGSVVTTHNEKRYDAYIFVGNNPTEILDGYWKVTGNPALYAENSFYIGHLNCYNRDEWTGPYANGKWLLEDGNRYNETNNGGKIKNGGMLETLNGTNDKDYKFSARAVIDGYVDNDMPFGWFLPNDGYGCGYGQSDASLDDNVNNLKNFTDYAKQYGVTTGLWTQSNLTPNPTEPVHLQRDFEKEVKTGGIRTLKTDVAWVGDGYSFGLNGITRAYNIIAETGERPTIITLDGWAGTQRYGGIWTGDQTGGNWEYIRFHIPTYIGQSLGGNPNVSSDVDGIFGGSSLIQTRDIQWKSFTTQLLDMDGWASDPKKPYAYGENTTSINRMYLKLRAELMPYIYTTAYTSSNLGDDVNEKGKPQVRAMFLEYPEDPYTYGTDVQYQFMMGKNLLVAPIYQNTAMDEDGNDIRNGIYLPDNDQIWIDYFSGKQYQGGRTLNNFDAPIWKMPLFVKNGAILPMYEENNNSAPVSEINTKGLDKTKRIVEFYPDTTQETYYDLIEDDGVALDNTNAEQPVYGSVVKTHFTSVVNDDTATLTAEASQGDYTGYDANRQTTFVVNVSKEPTSITATIGDTALTKDDFNIVTTQTAFDEAEGNVYFYNEAPNLNKYASDGADFASTQILTTPKVYVKFAKTNVNEASIQLTVNGFINDGNLNANTENSELSEPNNLKADDENITPTSIPLTWDAVEGATEYEIEADGIIQTGIFENTFTHSELEYNTKHTYRVRAVNQKGYSKWSLPIEATSDLDPYRNTISDLSISSPDDHASYSASKLIDFNFTDYYFSDWGNATVNNREKTYTFDLKKCYQMDKVDFYPGENTTYFKTHQAQEVSVYGSMDGSSYTPIVEHYILENTSGDTADTSIKSVPLDGAQMRYMRVIVHKPIGTYLALTEIMPYKVDKTDGIVLGDTNNDGLVDEKDVTQITNYVGVASTDAAWSQVVKSDYNKNNYYDAYDIAETTKRLNGGIKEVNEDVEGAIRVTTNKTSVKAGESVELTINGISLKNVYALGIRLPYRTEDFSNPSTSSTYATMAMTKFDFDRTVTDGSVDYNRYYNVVFSNLGDQACLNGSNILAKVTLTANRDMELDESSLNLSFANLVGNNGSEVDAIAQGEDPGKPESGKNVSIDEISSITFRNDINDNIDPSTLWQQENWKEILFDGKIYGNLATFKKYAADEMVPDYVKLPTDMDFTFDKAKAVKEVSVYNRARQADGALTSVKATAYSGETAYDLGTITGWKSVYTFKIPEGVDKIDHVVITPLTSSGVLSGTHTGSDYNRKLSMYEVRFVRKDAKKVESIAFAEDAPESIYKQRLTDIRAIVNPEDADFPYYKIESLHPDKVKILETLTNDGTYRYTLLGMASGDATIKATSLENEEISVEKTIHVNEFADIAMLEAAVKDLQATLDQYGETHFVESYYAKLMELMDRATTLLDTKDNQDTIDSLVYEIQVTLSDVQLKEANPDDLINKAGMQVIYATNYADSDYKENIIDNDPGTIWHSAYGASDTLPVEIITDLGDLYSLKEVDYLARQNSNNGHVTKAKISVSVDGETYTDVKTVTFASKNGWLVDYKNVKPIQFAPVNARYVKFTALETLGGTPNKYASISELNFYAENVEPTSIKFKEEEATIPVGGYYKSSLAFEPAGSHPDVTYETDSLDDYINVDENGIIWIDKDAPDYYLTTPITVTASVTKADGTTLSSTMVIHTVEVEKQHLQDAIKEATKFAEDTTIHPVIIKLLNESIDFGQLVYDNVNATNAQVKEAYDKLLFAIQCADFYAPKVQKLETLISQSQAIGLHAYDPAGQDTFKTTLAKAVDIYENVDTSLTFQEDVDKAYAALLEARNALVYLNTSAMEQLLSTAGTVLADIDSFVDGDAKDEFKAAYEAANTLYASVQAQKANPEAAPVITMQRITESNDRLSVSMTTLRKKPSTDLKDKINTLIDVVDQLDIEKYDAMQVRFVKAEAVALHNMLNNPYIPAEDVQSKYAALLPAVMELTPTTDTNVKAPEETKETLDVEDTKTTQETKKTPSSSNTSNVSKASTKGTTKPATGDTTGISNLLGAIGISGISAWVVNRKRKNKK